MTYYIKCRENYIIFPHSMIQETGWMSIIKCDTTKHNEDQKIKIIYRCKKNTTQLNFYLKGPTTGRSRQRREPTSLSSLRYENEMEVLFFEGCLFKIGPECYIAKLGW
jgi:hypothetical protein